MTSLPRTLSLSEKNIILVRSIFAPADYNFSVLIYLRKMPINAFRIMVNNLLKESYYEKKMINVLTTFFIFHKSCVKFFLK